MKRNISYLLLIMTAMFTVGHMTAEAGVNKVGETWVLSPGAWHPNPNKLHENLPFDLGEKSTADTDTGKLFSEKMKNKTHDAAFY